MVLEISRKFVAVLSLVLVFTLTTYTFETKAMEPATVAILAPIAIKYGAPIAKQAGIALAKGLAGGGVAMFDVVKEGSKILLLPVGVLQVVPGGAIGMAGSGFDNIGAGLMAPFKMAFAVVKIPMQAISSAGS